MQAGNSHLQLKVDVKERVEEEVESLLFGNSMEAGDCCKCVRWEWRWRAFCA
jgi:hypothetical protein